MLLLNCHNFFREIARDDPFSTFSLVSSPIRREGRIYRSLPVDHTERYFYRDEFRRHVRANIYAFFVFPPIGLYLLIF